MRTALIESHSVRNASRRTLKCIKVKQQIRLGVAEQTAKRLERRQLNRMQSDFVSADWLDKCGLVTMERCQQSKGQPHLLLVSFFIGLCFHFVRLLTDKAANNRFSCLCRARIDGATHPAPDEQWRPLQRLRKKIRRKKRERERSFLWPPSVRQAETGAKRNNGTMVSSTRI